MSTVTAVTAQSNQTKSAELTLPQRFGSGRYYSIQCEVFKDSQRLFQYTPEVAEKIAKAVATQLGHLFKTAQVELRGEMGKLNKDGQLKTIAEFAKIKNVNMCPELQVIRAMNYCNEAHVYHVNVVASLDGDLKDWVQGL